MGPVTPHPRRRDASEARRRLAGIAERAQSSFAANLAAIDAAVSALENGALDEATRRGAQRAAHRIAGAAGTVGLPAATEPARMVEDAFAGSPDPSTAGQLATRAADLRTSLYPEGIQRIPVPAPPEHGRVLAMHVAPQTAAEMQAIATSRGLGSTRDWADEDIDAAIVDLDVPEAEALIRRYASRQPAVPVVVLTDTTSVADRLRAAGAGASLVLPRSGPSADPFDAAQSLLDQRHDDRLRVLAVDDDPVVLAALRDVLATEPVQVSTVEDPRMFWGALEREIPDLVVLDLDMPHLDGIELCRLVRTDPRWSALPVLFLTAHTGSSTLDAVFAAGADDYVSKPLNPTEMRARVRNRLERVEMYRRLADTDPLTGAANRRRLEKDFQRLSYLARRHDQPLSVAMLDIDHFKHVNDTYGHGAGDLVIRRLTDQLTQEFRGEDVVARWGGDEIAVMAFGMSAVDAGQRLKGFLDSLGLAVGPTDTQPPVAISVSAGIAEMDTHGDTLDALLTAADVALYDAKRSGRSRVATAGDLPSPLDPGTAALGTPPADPAIRDYYNTLVERERLETTGHGRLEKLRTQELLARSLPPPPSRILDVGGGTGVYSRWLADSGHEVHLIDVVPEHVAEALSQGSMFTADVGDARHLEQPDDSADAVLLLGPLYHLLERADRLQALREAHRVLRPGGTLAASVVSRHAALLAYATRAEQDAAGLDLALGTLASGWYDPKLGFTSAYFHTPDEVVAEFRLAGFHRARVRPIEGPMWTSVKTCTDPLRRDALTESAIVCARALEDDPTLLAASAHLLATGHA